MRVSLPVAAFAIAFAASSAAADGVRVAGVQGTVEVQPAGEAWQPTATGATLAPGSRVAARHRAAVQLALGDDRLDLRADAVVALGTGGVRATVERGTVEHEVGDASRSVRLLTTAAQIEQRSGGALVTVDAGGVTWVANHGARTLRVRAVKAGRPTGRGFAVTAGSGVSIRPGSAPGKPRPLPPAPRWTTATARAVAVAGRAAPIRAEFEPIAGVTAYRVAIRTAGGDPVVAVPAFGGAETGAVTIHRLRPGAYSARIAAVDADGFESRPSAELSIEVFDLPAAAPGRDDLIVLDPAGGDPTEAPDPPHLTVGSRLIVPAALSCRVGDDAARPLLVIVRAGPNELRCQRIGEDVAAPIVHGDPLVVTLAERAGPPILPRRGTITLAFEVSDPAAAPAIEAVASGLRVIAVEHSETGVLVTIGPAGTTRGAELELVLRDAPQVTLTRVAIAMADPPMRVARAHDPPIIRLGRLRVTTGGYVGYIVFPTDGAGALELGNAEDPADLVSSGPTVGARIGLWPTRRVGLEAEIAVIAAGFARMDDRATVLAYRGHLGFRVLQEGRLGLHAVLGAGALSLVSSAGTAQKDTDSAAHWGIGVSVALPHRLELRLDARHLVGPARDAGFAHMFAVDLGLGARFGD